MVMTFVKMMIIIRHRRRDHRQDYPRHRDGHPRRPPSGATAVAVCAVVAVAVIVPRSHESYSPAAPLQCRGIGMRATLSTLEGARIQLLCARTVRSRDDHSGYDGDGRGYNVGDFRPRMTRAMLIMETMAVTSHRPWLRLGQRQSNVKGARSTRSFNFVEGCSLGLGVCAILASSSINSHARSVGSLHKFREVFQRAHGALARNGGVRGALRSRGQARKQPRSWRRPQETE